MKKMLTLKESHNKEVHTCIMAPGRSFVQWSPKQLITKSTELHSQIQNITFKTSSS